MLKDVWQLKSGSKPWRKDSDNQITLNKGGLEQLKTIIFNAYFNSQLFSPFKNSSNGVLGFWGFGVNLI